MRGPISIIVRRFIITVLLATILHAVGCILAPPFEFGRNRAECFFFAVLSGIIAFPILLAAVLLPLRAGLRRLMPTSAPLAHALFASIVLIAIRAMITLPRQLSGLPTAPFQHGYLAQWIFWSVFIVAITFTFFWPLRRTASHRPLA